MGCKCYVQPSFYITIKLCTFCMGHKFYVPYKFLCNNEVYVQFVQNYIHDDWLKEEEEMIPKTAVLKTEIKFIKLNNFYSQQTNQ